jgi:hypothetical protein
MKLMTLSALICFAFSATAFAHDMPAPKVSKDFETMKGLVGTWQGTTKMNGKDEPATVTYALTSGGTAIEEKLMPGTPHEMLTVYANRGSQVEATHYCALGNQPEMKLKHAANGVYEFEMDGTKGISNKNEMHMHAIKLTMAGDKLTQEWTNYDHGKKGETATFVFTKKGS